MLPTTGNPGGPGGSLALERLPVKAYRTATATIAARTEVEVGVKCGTLAMVAVSGDSVALRRCGCCCRVAILVDWQSVDCCTC